MLLTISSFLFVFTVVAIVHEAGHLFFSKRAGIRVHEFGIGFGPTIWQTKRDNTVYKLNIIPILGYVKIAGIDTEDPQEKETPETEKYYNKPASAKFMSIFAGAFMNIILGFVVFSFVIALTGIPAGTSNIIKQITPGSVAAKVGLMAGDRLLGIDGNLIGDPEKAVEIIHQSADKEIQLIIDRSGKTMNIAAIPQYHKRMKVGLIGFALEPKYSPVNPLLAIYYGGKQTVGMILMVFSVLGRLVTGHIGLGDLAGPVGIAQISGQYAQQGLISLLSFLAFFSVNIAVLNLLPIPALDGGRLIFVLIELITGKAVDIEKENKIHSVGMTVLLILIAIISVNDILRFFR
ncbi:MAG: RIP metalloprotease RseP [bacterium]